MEMLRLRNRQRKPRLLLCAGVYGAGDTPKKIINFGERESQYRQPVTTVDCSQMKESEVVLKSIVPPDVSQNGESFLQESHL